MMRPLAHLLHPASVRVGLIPATRSLAGNFHIEAESRVVELDAQGALLDDDVRLQVFRWIRYLMPAGDSIDMTISIEGDSLRLHAHGVRQSRALDPIQRVAGLAVRSLDSSAERCIIAPRAGTFVGVEDDSLVVPQQIERSRGDRWFLLTRSPVMNVRLVLLVGLVTMPVAIAWANSQFAGAPAVAIILGVLVPAGLAMVLTRIHVPEGTRRGTWLSIGLWLALGIVAGLANILGFWLLAPDTAPWVFIRIVGGLWRYTLIGLLIVAAQGLVAQTMADAARLRAGIESALADRRGVLAGADRTDRFLSETLHRTVQGRLSAISLLLRFERRPEAIVELGRLVSDTLPTIEARLMEGSNAGIDSSERRVSDEIGLGLNDSVDWASLERSDPELARQFHLVVEECSVNARRHGGAQWMRVFMTVSADWLTLHCHDDGRGPGPQGPGSGLGSRLFDEVCAESGGTWSLVRGDVLTEFALCVPLVPPSRTTGSPEA
ncbi:MAG: hypothetical protein F2793_03465 [Actinobacteria bacterium]|nr:hypothetical protein [Actinomycetota bacterium]